MLIEGVDMFEDVRVDELVEAERLGRENGRSK